MSVALSLPTPKTTIKALLVAELPRLQSRARQLARTAADADDLVQDTIERALRFESSFETGSNLRAWVMQVMHSVFVTRYRRRQRERAAMNLLACDESAWTKPEGSVPVLPLCRSTERVIAKLPEAFREVICLVDLGELSYKEAATELRVPVGTVMSRLHRARRLLSMELEPAKLPKAEPARAIDVPRAA